MAVRLRLVPAALAVGVAVALAGCSAGQTAQTENEVAAVSGGYGTVQNIAVRNAVFTFPAGQAAYPAGSDLPLSAVLVNQGSEVDRLVQVSSTYAASAQITGATTLPGGTSVIVTGALPASPRPTGSSPATSNGTTAPGASAPSSPPGATSPTSPTPTTAAPTSPLPPTQAGPATAPSGAPTVTITITGLRQTITPGVTIPVTFVFERAGAVTVQVPIGEDPNPRPQPSE